MGIPHITNQASKKMNYRVSPNGPKVEIGPFGITEKERMPIWDNF